MLSRVTALRLSDVKGKALFRPAISRLFHSLKQRLRILRAVWGLRQEKAVTTAHGMCATAYPGAEAVGTESAGKSWEGFTLRVSIRRKEAAR